MMMKNKDFKYALFILSIAFVLSVSFRATAHSTEPNPENVEIFHIWSGDYPVARLALLPDGQRDSSAGFIDNAETLASVWINFKPGEAVPAVDFIQNLILFVRNTQFYNRISISRVVLKDGMAEIEAMETMSAMPIEDKVGMSLAVVPRKNIRKIKTGDAIIELPDK